MTDAFNVAFRIPNLFRRLFGEGAFSQAFVPVLAARARQRGRGGDAPADRRVATVLAWALLVADLRGRRGRRAVLVWVMASGLARASTPPWS